MLCAAILALGLSPLMAANITYTISGTLGPVLSGSDPLGANGESGILTATVATTATPTSKTKTSATYTLPQGAVTVNVGGTVYSTTGPATVKFTFPATGADTMVFNATISVDGFTGTVIGTASLANGSFTSAMTKHPRKFTPSPQNLSPAKKASGPGSKVEYTVAILGSSTLGVTGTASN